MIILIILVLFLLMKINNNKITNNKNESQELELLRRELNNTIKSFSEQINYQNQNINTQILSSSKNTTDSIDKKISNQNLEQLQTFKNALDTLEQKIGKQTLESQRQTQEVIERVAKLDFIGNKIIGLNDNISNLEKVLNDKKARGSFGEARLSQIFVSIFGKNKTNIYEEQYKLSNGKIVDFIMHAPYPLGDLAIDSKFPLENYNKIVSAQNDEEEKIARKNFTQDLKKHINDISSKYIIKGETASQAIMFIPAEAIFAEINAHHLEIVEYSYQNRVWITSPTTLMAILNLLIVVLKDARRNNATEEIYQELIKLNVEFERYQNRWDKFNNHLEILYKDAKDITTTSSKISKRFKEIEDVEFINE